MDKEKLNISSKELVAIKPITDNQKEAFKSYEANKNLFLYGVAGTGKTFIALYLALKNALDTKSPQKKLYIVRSL